MRIIVKKFGGSSVADIALIRKVADRIKEFQAKEPESRIVVVVSAMAGETDRLLKLGQSCVEHPSARELDVLAATGEQVSIALLAMALQEKGLKAQSVLGYQAGIGTDSAHQSAQIDQIDPLLRYIHEVLWQAA